ncbi:addiction module protein [Peristeroidobacter soli]|uniref:addiction module protein n=1 Tax=Peristeroidobacter soli TaxID=2497877 RepID=UPI00101B6546|nr:addiction module protein [Peristeroidobacter soli]
MTRSISEIEREIRKLERPAQERLLRTLLEELDGPGDMDADRAWLQEIQRRSAEFDAGLMKTIPAEQVFERARARLKR